LEFEGGGGEETREERHRGEVRGVELYIEEPKRRSVSIRARRGKEEREGGGRKDGSENEPLPDR